MPPDPADSYDALPYPDVATYLSHPRQTAVAAILSGLEPPPLAGCRVLELGCASGFNLLAMSQSLPGATFVGIDRSEGQVAAGRGRLARLGVTNVELRAADLMDLGDGLGEFDYVVAHGLFSWVPGPVRERVLALVRRHLAPRGVGYVSYNCYPGWHKHRMVRDLCLAHDPKSGAPAARVAAVQAGLARTAAELPDPDSPRSAIIKAAVARLAHAPDSYLFHEYLESDNHPLRFADFAALLAAAGLRHLADARLEAHPALQPPDTRAALAAHSDDPLRQEQYLDELIDRDFRHSLVGHPGTAPTFQPWQVARLSARGTVEEVGPSPDDAEVARYRVNGTHDVDATDPLIHAVLASFAAAGPRVMGWDELSGRILAHFPARPGPVQDPRPGLARAGAGLRLAPPLLAPLPPMPSRPPPPPATPPGPARWPATWPPTATRSSAGCTCRSS